jgi:hypothetical protein
MTPSIEQLKWRHILITTLLENLDNEVQYEMKVVTSYTVMIYKLVWLR